MERLDPNLVKRVGERVAAHAGLHPPGWVLEARLARRLAAQDGLDPGDYAALLESADGARELDLLVEALRVGETRFFRHRAHAQAVTQVVLPALAAARADGPVRAWSAGCATGEEPYTLAILLSRGLPAPRYQVSVVATDISREALDVARAGVYPEAALEHVPPEVRRVAFEPAGPGQRRVAGSIAGLVSFALRNLADTDYPRQMDLIWCRNVLIYFTPEARRAAIERLIGSLAPGGFLFVGYAESLRDMRALEVVQTPDAILYRRPAASGAARAPASTRAAAVPPSITPRDRAAAHRDPSAGPTATASAGPTATATAGPAATATATASTTAPAARQRAAPVPRPAEVRGLEPAEAVIELSGRYESGERLSSELVAALGGSYRRVVIDLDGAAFLGDDAGPVLRRACSAARAAGIEVVLMAVRPGVLRWLRRSGLGDDVATGGVPDGGDA